MNKRREEGGYAALIMVMLLAVAGFAIASSVDRSATGSKTVHAAKLRSTQYYEAEAGVGRAVSWLRQNSQRMLIPFRRENFYSSFDRTAPTVGANDVSLYTVPTKLKMDGSNDSVMISNDATLGTSAFPLTEDIHTGVTFDVEG